MPTVKLCLLGFGNVGQALAQLILEKRNAIREQYALDFQVVAIKTGRHGTCVDRAGIDLLEALKAIKSGESLDYLSREPIPDELDKLLEISTASSMVENTPVSYLDGQPALDHIRKALEQGIHVVTANKGPLVHGYYELTQLAARSNCKFMFESTVMDGAPIFAIWRETLPGAILTSFRGILNSTTNLILTRMESGESFDEAVSYAQSIGIAETDPAGDVDGWDAAIKVAALVNVLMGIKLLPEDVEREGIRGLESEQVTAALDRGQRWKLVCEARRQADAVNASVKLQLVDRSDSLFSVMGTSSAITFQSDVLGALTVTEADPGPHTTAYGLLADLLNIHRSSI